ncbi:MAG: hypothetical protein LBS30_07110, partial [Planctomycetota bacterium]|nr:hypothetical protein [Planctomycetota bacterium]
GERAAEFADCGADSAGDDDFLNHGYGAFSSRIREGNSVNAIADSLCTIPEMMLRQGVCRW